MVIMSNIIKYIYARTVYSRTVSTHFQFVWRDERKARMHIYIYICECQNTRREMRLDVKKGRKQIRDMPACICTH